MFVHARNPASHQPSRCVAMGSRVEVREGETVARALARLKEKVEAAQRRRFIKGKWGDHYVKPCEVRRRLEYEARCWKKRCKLPKN